MWKVCEGKSNPERKFSEKVWEKVCKEVLRRKFYVTKLNKIGNLNAESKLM